MSLAGLSLKEVLLICRLAEQRCARQFRMILERVDPSDRSLCDLVGQLVEEEEEHARRIERYDQGVDWPLVWHVDEAELERLIRQNFPALSRSISGAHMEREEVLRLASELERESCRLYRTLARDAPDESSRTFFSEVAEGEESHLRRLEELSAS